MNGPRFAAAAALLLAACSTVPPERQAASAPVPPPAAPAPPSYGGPAEQAAAEAVERIRRLDPQIQSVIAIDPTWQEQARRVDASGLRGPLAGKPVLIKDNIDSIGPLPTTAGSLALTNNVTNRDSPLVARLRAAGAIIVGKTNLSEWANIRSTNSISGWSAVGGQTRNPHALDRNTCGSSSGSGAAVAAGLVRLAVGTETDGSVTCPAAMNGVVGLKPTVGLIPRTYIIPISESQDTAGPMTASVAEAAAMLTVMAGSDAADPATKEADSRKQDYAAGLSPDALKGKKVGVLRFAAGFGTDEPFEKALATLRAAGAELVEIKEFKRQDFGDAEFQVLLTEFKAGLNDYLKNSPAPLKVRSLADVIAFNSANSRQEMPLFAQEIFEMAEKTRGLDDKSYRKARADSLRMAGAEGIDRLLKQHGVVALVAPSRPAAWKIDAVHGDVSPGGNGIGSMAAVAGYPHLTVPMGQVRGLPVGLSFFGPKWSDALLLQLGFAFEQARGPLPGPRFLRSIEEAPEIAPALDRQLQPGN